MHALRREMGGLMLTPEQCAEIKRRWAAATPGPWWYDGHMYVWRGGPHAVAGMVADSECRDLPGGAVVRIRGAGARLPMDENATAIAAAPTDIAALLATVEALRSELADVRAERDAEWALATQSGRELAEAVELLQRAVKYATEDRAVTPRSTRLARLLVEVSAFLARHRGA